jgi:hypothetical protein
MQPPPGHPVLTPAAGRGGPPAAGRGGPTDVAHDEQLRRGIIHTQISRGTAWALVVLFLLLIAAVPLTQIVVDKLNDDAIVLLDLFRRPLTKDNLKQLEQDLDNNSLFRTWVQPRMQALLTRNGRAGNKKAVVGHGGWLYYQPGVAYLGGPPFLSDDIIQSRRRAARMEAGAEVHPDPRPAILAFAQALAARGIKLILVPIPDKAMLQPAQLHGRWPTEAALPPPRNPDFSPFVAQMQAAGVLVFDATPPSLSPTDAPRFLAQDTHWTPAWMAQVARDLAAFVRTNVALPSTASAISWHEQSQPVQRVGDIVDMLKLPDDQTLYPPIATTVAQVLDATGAPFAPDPAADVLLLGDSFTNIFTQAPMGWGESAGFAPHLALALGRPLDVIAQNDAGAFATRQLLARELGAGVDRLAGKRIVIWEFAVRELGVGDWKPVSFVAPPAPPAPPASPASPAPRPSEAP